MPALVLVGASRVIEPVKSFGQAYLATPDDDEFECEYEPKDPPGQGAIVASGSNLHVRQFVEADLEGLSLITSVSVPLGNAYPLDLLVVQNGQAPGPSDTGDINGYELDGATQFMYVNFLSTLAPLYR